MAPGNWDRDSPAGNASFRARAAPFPLTSFRARAVPFPSVRMMACEVVGAWAHAFPPPAGALRTPAGGDPSPAVRENASRQAREDRPSGARRRKPGGAALSTRGAA